MLREAGVDASVKFHHDQFEFNNGSRPPHHFDVDVRRAHYANVDRLVYMDRDPRDVMVSLYHQVTGRFADLHGYRGTLSEFIRDAYFGAEVLARFRNIWSSLVDEFGFLRVSYESVHEDAGLVIRKIADYYGVRLTDSAIAAAVRAGSHEAMRAVELSGKYAEPWLRLRMGHPKVREGKVGGYRRHFDPEDLAYLDAIFAPISDP